jgi:hypothetical protein
VRRLNLEERYRVNIRHEQKILEEFASSEREWADNLLLWYRLRNKDIPDDEYRAVAFFSNREYLGKPGSLTLLFSMRERLMKELPSATKENAFYLLAFRFRIYAQTLAKGGYN